MFNENKCEFEINERIVECFQMLLLSKSKHVCTKSLETIDIEHFQATNCMFPP